MKTLVFGASLKEERYSNKAIRMLLDYGHQVEAIGGRAGEVQGIQIKTGHPFLDDVHTITMYMGEKRQKEHMDYLIGLSPKRVLFNPGAEHAAFEMMLRDKGILVERACTLVLLRTGQYDSITESAKK